MSGGVNSSVRNGVIRGMGAHGPGTGTVAAYGGNYLVDNYGVNPEVSGGVQVGPNRCNGAATCP